MELHTSDFLEKVEDAKTVKDMLQGWWPRHQNFKARVWKVVPRHQVWLIWREW